MNTNYPILASALWLVASMSASAQEAPRAPAPEASPPAAESPEPPAPDEDEPRTLEDIFIPSDEIAADEEVVFPVNI